MSFSLMNKRASELDVIPILIGVAVVAIIAPFIKVYMDSTGDVLTAQGYTRTDGNFLIPADTTGFFNALDNISVFLFLGLTAAAGYFAYLNPSVPIMMMFVLFLMVFIILVSVILSNFYESFTNTTDEITAASATQVKTKNLMDNLPIYATVALFIIIVILYSRWSY